MPRPKTNKKIKSIWISPELSGYLDDMPWGTMSAWIEHACRRQIKLQGEKIEVAK